MEEMKKEYEKLNKVTNNNWLFDKNNKNLNFSIAIKFFKIFCLKLFKIK